MKIRNGFVSNSSSSSFIAGLPKALNRKERKELLLKKMKIDENSLFYNAATEVINCILNADKISKIEQIMNDYSYSTVEDLREDFPGIVKSFEKCKEKEMDVFSGSVSNDDYEIGERLFCEMGWKVDDEDFFIDKEEGF